MVQSSRSPIRFHVDPIFHRELDNLPWTIPISDWHRYGVNILTIKRGISRHAVIFVKSGRFSFGIKEISEEIAKKEIDNYEQLLLMGIHTLIPVGYVVREEEPIPLETPMGIQYERNNVAHTVTLLVEKVIPDSQLYSRNFRKENQRIIFDAIIRLFVQLHSNGVYWGDASLANTLIKFEKMNIPFIGKKTVLAAYLADAETVEIRPSLSQSMRDADLNFFFESMEWVTEDIERSGAVVDKNTIEENRRYIKMEYDVLYAVELKKKKFETDTEFNIDQFLGRITDPSYVDQFIQHIEEHKWYLSERIGGSITLAAATRDWYETIFVPVCELFRSEHIVDVFHGKTAAELYVEIMNNKYYLSEQAGTDVGMITAMNDYAQRFGVTASNKSLLKKTADKMLGIFGLRNPGGYSHN